MKYQIVLLSLIVSLGGCGQRGASNENIQEEKPGTAVTLTHAAFGKIEKEIILSATTAYQNKSVVSAPIPAFITEVLVQPGSRVKAGDILYRIESKEQHALGNGNHAVIPIKAEREALSSTCSSRQGVMSPKALCFAPLPKPEASYSRLTFPTNRGNMRTAEANVCWNCPTEPG